MSLDEINTRTRSCLQDGGLDAEQAAAVIAQCQDRLEVFFKTTDTADITREQRRILYEISANLRQMLQKTGSQRSDLQMKILNLRQGVKLDRTYTD